MRLIASTLGVINVVATRIIANADLAAALAGPHAAASGDPARIRAQSVPSPAWGCWVGDRVPRHRRQWAVCGVQARTAGVAA
jgi:hypothetical protein